MTSYHVSLTADETLSSSNTFAESAVLALTVAPGSYTFSLVAPVSRSTAHGGAIGVSASSAISASFVGYATVPYTTTALILNDSTTVNAGGNVGFVFDAPTTDKQLEQATGVITCAAATTLKIGVYSSTTQNITLGKGTTFSLV